MKANERQGEGLLKSQKGLLHFGKNERHGTLEF